MGRKTTKEATIKIRTNPVRGRRGNIQCAEELQQFFVCMTVRESLLIVPRSSAFRLVRSVSHCCVKLYYVRLQKSGGSNTNTVCSKEIQALRSCAAAAVRDQPCQPAGDSRSCSISCTQRSLIGIGMMDHLHIGDLILVVMIHYYYNEFLCRLEHQRRSTRLIIICRELQG